VTSYQLKSFDASYDVGFGMPFFELSRTTPEILESLYRELHDIWVLGPQELKVSQGAVVGDSYVHANLFNGNGEVRLTTTSCYLSFRNAVEKDVELVVRTTSACLRAVSSHVPTELWNSEFVKANLTLGLESEQDRTAFLERVGSQCARVASDPHRVVVPSFKVEHQSSPSSPDWRVSLDITQRWGMPSELYVVVNGSFHSPATRGTLDDRLKSRVAAIGSTCDEVFKALDLQRK
jgi:hypothetical protein